MSPNDYGVTVTRFIRDNGITCCRIVCVLIITRPTLLPPAERLSRALHQPEWRGGLNRILALISRPNIPMRQRCPIG
jgi:hypothetical protein